MNKQRKVLITVTYNEMGIIIDTKAEEVAKPNLQPTCNQLATDAISRQAAIELATQYCPDDDGSCSKADRDIRELLDDLENLPSAQPELPKQFMSDDCISRSELYKKVCEAEKLARERVLDTPSDSQFPNKLNPAYTRYSAQLDERTQIKHMIADARSVQPDIIRCKDCIKRDYCRTTNIWAVPPDDDWYCGDAERREE